MTIDEAIAHEKEKAKEQRSHIGTWDEEYSKKCEMWAKEHEQLAEWLEELKDYRDKNKMVVRIDCINSEEFNDLAVKLAKEQYNKAIDDFVNAIIKRGLSKNNDKYCITHYDNFLTVIKEIAEQLKAGVNK